MNLPLDCEIIKIRGVRLLGSLNVLCQCLLLFRVRCKVDLFTKKRSFTPECVTDVRVTLDKNT